MDSKDKDTRSIRAKIDRRNFIKLSGLLSTGALLPIQNMYGLASFSSKPVDVEELKVSGLSIFIIMDMIGKLAKGNALLGSDFQHALSYDISSLVPGNSYFMGMNMPFSQSELIDAFILLKNSSHPGNLDYKAVEHLSILMGALVERSFQSILYENAEVKSCNMDDRIYKDAVLVRDFYTVGNEFDGESIGQIENLLKEFVPRTFIRFHTIMPDIETGMDWVLKMQDWRKQTDEYFHQLAAAIVAPDLGKIKTIISDTGYYHSDDPILIKLSTFNRISPLYESESLNVSNLSGHIDQELFNTYFQMNKCAVSKALLNGLLVILYLNEFWKDTLGEEKLRKFLVRY